MSSNSLTRPIAPAEQPLRKWTVYLNGREQPHVNEVRLESRFGRLVYGWTSSGHDGWTFHESGGGGAVVVPFLIVAGDLFVGVVEQQRPLQGGVVANVPRGFVDPGELHGAAARRELLEETSLAGEPFELGGLPVNPNSAFFETPQPDLGVRFFGLRVPEACVVPCDSGFRLTTELAELGDRTERLAEQIGDLRFLDWTQVIGLGDMFSVAAVGRLIAHLVRSGELALVPLAVAEDTENRLAAV